MKPGFVFQLAWRESRKARRRLLLLVGSVTAGVAALVAINGFTENLQVSVAEQAQAMLGADLELGSRQPFSERVESLVDTLLTGTPPGRKAAVTSFAGMAYVGRTEGARLVQVRAVEPGYPFYGSITTEPAGRWGNLALGGRTLVDGALLAALGARVGDTLSLGEGRFLIDGVVTNVPGDVGVTSAFGPRVYIPAADLEATGLVRFGSRVDYDLYLKLPDAAVAQEIASKYRLSLRGERVRIETVEDDREDLTDALTRLGNYLGLVALIALLLGGLGVASATHLFIRQKLDTIAVLRCLGATARQVFLAYLVQALAMGALGSLVGATLGVLVQQTLPLLVADLLPVDVEISIAPRAVLLGIALGVWVATVFALLPLLAVRRVSPLVTLRRATETTSSRRDPVAWGAALLLAASVVGLASVQVGSLRDGAVFAGGVGAVVLVLWLSALGLSKGIRRWFPSGLPYLWRQGLANLYRPANQTVTVVLALGFGAFLLSTLFLVQHNLLREFRLGGTEVVRPNLMFFDIQPDQAGPLSDLLETGGFESPPMVPIVPMRILSVDDRPVTRGRVPDDDPLDDPAVDSVEADSASGPRPIGGWAARREYRSTYRSGLTDTERLVSGEWWDSTAATWDPGTPARISVETDVARELGVELGSSIVWDVQGVQIPSRVTSLREVNWNRFQTNFFVVFEPGPLDRAPQMLVSLTRVDSAAARGALQRRVAERFPNVSAIDLAQVQQAIEGILDKAVLAVRFLALFSLAAGVIVLLGAITTARLERLREGVLLKTLGATRRQVLWILVAEYVAIGVLAATVSIVLSSTAGWALAKWVFEAPYRLPALSLVGLTGVIVGVTLFVGLVSGAEVLKRPPLEVLRTET
ncbi:MAG: FtsX-like permease family protein [Gemmatimonadales bacterium]